MSGRIGVFGESLVDIVVGGEEHPGGSPMNVAVGLARLGHPTVLHSRVGSDVRGDRIRAHLAEAGVETGERTMADGASWTATATLDDEGRAQYAFALPGDIEVPDLSGLALLHTGSIGALRDPGSSALLAALRAAPASMLRCLDPNIRAEVIGPAEAARDRVRELALECHVVKLSDEDAAWLLPGRDPADALALLADLGVRFAVMTMGDQGCLAVVDGRRIERPAIPVVLADTIGAGDAFMSGLLAALLRDGTDRLLAAGAPVPEAAAIAALDTALASAAVAVSRAGAEPPYPAELARMLETRGR
ncbi:fructokinase [Microbacterium resistens]|uniref:Fructokinase n=1 Tax=Microbacterium resistens TaxID=156977 RepID=A0ABU1SCM5_9MICO|nr:PfkB family carbohydrate kinase [Microbacterium resistens]MDR6867357.1 fructokinase [Microbacterium resistens]